MKWTAAHVPPAPSPGHCALDDLLARHGSMSIGRRWRVWRDMGAPREVVRWIRYGVMLPWSNGPPPPTSRKSSPARSAAEEVGRTNLVAKLVDAGHIVETSTDAFASPFWAEPKKDELGLFRPGKFRFLHDLTALNGYLVKKVTRYENLRALPTLARSGDWATCLDLTDFFYSIPLHPSHRKYVSFVHGGVVYEFRCLPMGLSLSPFFCTKITRWVLSLLRGKGFRLLWYVDDILLVSTNKRIREQTSRLREILTLLGFTINSDKGFVEPRRKFIFLGLVVDLRRRRFGVPDHKSRRLADACTRTIHHARSHHGFVPRKALAGIAGLAESVVLAAPTVREFTRAVSALAGAGGSTKRAWSGSVRLTNQVRHDIQSLLAVTSTAQWGRFESQTPTAECWSDASVRGYGCAGEVGGVKLPDVAGYFGRAHVSGDITVLEMEAVVRGVTVWGPSLRNRSVQWHIDNLSVVHCIRKRGSRTPRVMAAYRALCALTRRYRVDVQPEWIPTLDNEAADTLSRRHDVSEYRVSGALPARAAAAWPHLGPPDQWHDRFASATAHQRGMSFDARFPHPDATNWDTFRVPWGDGAAPTVSWLTPPLGAIGRVCAKVRQDSAIGVLLHPIWAAQPWSVDLNELTMASLDVGPIAPWIFMVPGLTGRIEALRNPKWVWRLSLISGGTRPLWRHGGVASQPP